MKVNTAGLVSLIGVVFYLVCLLGFGYIIYHFAKWLFLTLIGIVT